MTKDSPPILSVSHLKAAYDGVIVALRDISIEVPSGRIVALLGANGAGKSTTLKAISRLLAAERGEILTGEILYQGRSTATATPGELVAAGLIQVLEGRHVFSHLSVEENLVAGSLWRSLPRSRTQANLERIYAYFPRLKLLRKRKAGLASGGEQQMMALGRALMSEPRLILLDEPSMGLAPAVTADIFGIIASLNRAENVSFLLAEQNATLALKHAHHGYVIENGAIVLSGTAEALRLRDDIKHFYLGIDADGRRRFALTESPR